MNRERLFKALAEIVLYADLDELPWQAACDQYGKDTVQYWWENALEMNGEDEFVPRMNTVELFLRLANGHAMPKNVGLKEQFDIVYGELGIKPEEIGAYEP